MWTERYQVITNLDLVAITDQRVEYTCLYNSHYMWLYNLPCWHHIQLPVGTHQLDHHNCTVLAKGYQLHPFAADSFRPPLGTSPRKGSPGQGNYCPNKRMIITHQVIYIGVLSLTSILALMSCCANCICWAVPFTLNSFSLGSGLFVSKAMYAPDWTISWRIVSPPRLKTRYDINQQAHLNIVYI